MPGKTKSLAKKPAGRKKQAGKSLKPTRPQSQINLVNLQTIPEGTLDKARNGGRSGLRPADILSLQRTYGNQAVQRLLQRDAGSGSANSHPPVRGNNGLNNGTHTNGGKVQRSLVPVMEKLHSPTIQRGKHSEDSSSESETGFKEAMRYFKKLNRSLLFGGKTKAKRKKLAVKYHDKEMKQAQKLADESIMKKSMLKQKDFVDRNIRRAYRNVFGEEIPMAYHYSKEVAPLSFGGLDPSTPDFADPSLKKQEPDEYKITVVASLEKINWNKVLDTLLVHYALIGYTGLRQLLVKSYRDKIAGLTDTLQSAGHTWVRLSTYVKGKMRELSSFGFYPRGFYDIGTGGIENMSHGISAASPGQVRHPDIFHENDLAVKSRDYSLIAKDKARYQKAMSKAQALYKDPPPYVALSYNCTTFARDVLRGAGFSFPSKGVVPKFVLTPGKLSKSLKDDPKKDKPLSDKIKEITEQTGKRKAENIKKMHLAEGKKSLIKEMVELGLISAKKAGSLKVSDLKLLYAFRSYRNRGGELIKHLKDPTERPFIFREVQQRFNSSTENLNSLYSAETAPITLGSLNRIGTKGAAILGAHLGISRTKLQALKKELGVAHASWTERDKVRIGKSVGLTKEEMPGLTIVDVKAFSRFKRMMSPKIKGKKKLDPADFIKRYEQLKYKKQDLGYISKISEAGKKQIAKQLGLKGNAIDWLLQGVKVRAGVSKSGRHKIPGGKRNKVVVYHGTDFLPIAILNGGTDVFVLDSAVKSDEFLTIRFRNAKDGKMRDGVILGAHLTKRPTRKTKAVEKIKQRRRVKRPVKGEKPILAPERQLALFSHAYELEKADQRHREPEILGYCYQLWKQTNAGKAWQPKPGNPAPKAFFTYVSGLESQHDVHLVEKIKSYVGKKLWQGADDKDRNATKWVETRKAKNIPIIPKVTYLRAGPGARGRERYRLAFAGNKISYVNGGPLPSEKHIYVMTPGMEFYAKAETNVTQLGFHHSSFLGGEKVGAAGALDIEGSSFAVDLESGHYRPEKLQYMVNALQGLQRKGVPLDSINARPIYDKKQNFIAGAFLKMVQVVKSMPDTLLNKLATVDYKKLSKAFKKQGVVEEPIRLKYLLQKKFRDQMKKLKM